MIAATREKKKSSDVDARCTSIELFGRLLITVRASVACRRNTAFHTAHLPRLLVDEDSRGSTVTTIEGASRLLIGTDLAGAWRKTGSCSAEVR